MFKMTSNQGFVRFLAILIAFQNGFWITNASIIVPPVKELCPCISRAICPRTYGTSALVSKDISWNLLNFCVRKRERLKEKQMWSK